jgi:heat shock protein HtpX
MDWRQVLLFGRSVVALGFGVAALPVLFVTGALVVGKTIEIGLVLAGAVLAIVAVVSLLLLDLLFGVSAPLPSVPDGPLFPALYEIHPFLFWGLLGAVVTVGAVALFVWTEYLAATEDTRRPSSDERWIVDAVERLARQVDVPTPRLRVLPDDRAVAYTVQFRGRPTIVVSEGIVECLDRDELEAVLAHEVAHVLNGDTRTATGFAVLTGLAIVPLVIGLSLVGSGRYATLVGVALAVLGGVQAVVVAVGGRIYFPAREYLADDAAAAITGDPTALAAAVETLHDREPPETDLRETEPLSTALNVVSRSDWTAWVSHPPADRRVQRLRERTREVESAGG